MITEVSKPSTTTPLMEAHLYDLIDSMNDVYWRYIARHEIFLHLWEKYREVKDEYSVLDIGCGAGNLLAYLNRRSRINPVGIDMFSGVLAGCKRRDIHSVSVADAVHLPFPTNHFDFAIAQDVVEHIEDDKAAVSEIFRVCAPGGLTLILVPAFQQLWSTRDVKLHHYRRYTLPQLETLISEAGFLIEHRTYTDMFLYPLLLAAIITAPKTSDGVANITAESPGSSALLNKALLAVSRLEKQAIIRTGLPFGVSAVVMARKPKL